MDNETAMEFLKPALKNILEVYLKIMEDIDSEELIGALEVIMEKFHCVVRKCLPDVIIKSHVVCHAEMVVEVSEGVPRWAHRHCGEGEVSYGQSFYCGSYWTLVPSLERLLYQVN